MPERNEPPLKGGELNASISKAVVKIQSQYLGRGPTKAHTFHHDNVVVTVLEESLTKAERSLVSHGKLDAVLTMRHEFQRTMREDLVAEVERLSGQRVRAFMSDNHAEPDIAAEIFILDGPL